MRISPLCRAYYPRSCTQLSVRLPKVKGTSAEGAEEPTDKSPVCGFLIHSCGCVAWRLNDARVTTPCCYRLYSDSHVWSLQRRSYAGQPCAVGNEGKTLLPCELPGVTLPIFVAIGRKVVSQLLL